MEFLTRKLEEILKTYIATFQGSGDPLEGATLREGHSSATTPDDTTDTVTITAGEVGGDFIEGGNYDIPVQILIKTAATTAGLTTHDAWTQEIVNIFADARHAVVIAALNAIAPTEILVSAVRIDQSDEGRDPAKERHGTALRLLFEGVCIPP